MFEYVISCYRPRGKQLMGEGYLSNIFAGKQNIKHKKLI